MYQVFLVAIAFSAIHFKLGFQLKTSLLIHLKFYAGGAICAIFECSIFSAIIFRTFIDKSHKIELIE